MSPQKRIRLVLRRQGSLEDRAAREQLRILQQVRRAVLSDLGHAMGFNRMRLVALLSAVDAEITTGAGRSTVAAIQATRKAFGLGEDMVRAVSKGETLVGVSDELLQSAVEVTTGQLNDVWAELGTRLRSVIRRVTFGVTDPDQGASILARSIGDPKVFGRARARAETIVRTEVNRTFSMAGQGEMARGNAAGGFNIRKYWLTAEDGRVRDAHKEAGKKYGKDTAIPWDTPFEVDGEQLMFPLDPAGSPENTINCRCVSVPVVLEA